MQQQPSVIATGDFLYFAPAGQAFTVPAAGVVSAAALPGAADTIWTTFGLGTVMKPTTDKYEGKDVVIKQPLPGTGIIIPQQILRPDRGLTMEVTMNEFSRLSVAGFYKSPLIMLTDTAFYPLAGEGSLQGWLKRQQYDNTNGLYKVDNWWVDLNCTKMDVHDDNVVSPTFTFTWLYSGLAGSAI